MALETAVNIADLVKTNPGAGDPKSQGDDHIRNLKTVLQNAFAGFTGSVFVTGTDGGAADVYTLTPANALPAYGNRMLIAFSPTVNGTGPATINISGLGAKAIKSVTGAAMTLGDLIVGQLYLAMYNGTEFRLTSMTKNYIDQLAFAAAGFPNQAGNAGKALVTDGTNPAWISMDLRGGPVFSKGNSGTTAQVVTYTDGEGQTLTSTGTFSLSATGFPASRISGVILRLINGGANGFSTSGINWIKSDGSLTTAFSSAGVTLQASGTDLILLLSYGDGTVYAKAAR
jgi:hypothetical protein